MVTQATLIIDQSQAIVDGEPFEVEVNTLAQNSMSVGGDFAVVSEEKSAGPLLYSNLNVESMTAAGSV
jgi:hypothetical protein